MARPTTRTCAAALAVCTVLSGVTALTAPSAFGGDSGNKTGQVHNVIYLLGDGMGRTHVTAGRQRFYGAAGKLNMERLPVVGQVATYAVEKNSSRPALVTDSASSATAWSSGVKTYNAAIGVDAYGKQVGTLMEKAHAAGYRTGNVSTAEVTDATPAGMYSHALQRGCQGPTYSLMDCGPMSSNPLLTTPIAKQIATNGTADVILGGGLARFDPADSKALTAQGYEVLGNFGHPNADQQTADTQSVATKSELEATTSRRVIGLFNRGNMTVETTKDAAPAASPVKQEPTLAEMTGKALSLLDASGDKHGKGFLLQVEGALIDKRSHANDATQTLGEIKAFDDAVKVASDFAARDGHTLVIVTADHECAGFNIIEKGTITNAEAVAPPANTDTTDKGNPANNSVPTRSKSGAKDPNRSSGIQNGAGLTGPNPAGNFAAATFRTADDGPDVKDGSPEASLWLSYLSGNHTGADVPLFASGPGSDVLAHELNNTDLYGIMLGSLHLSD